MVIGITGGIGSGKSTVCRILKDKYNAHIIIADIEAALLYMPGEAAYTSVVAEFGDQILMQNDDVIPGLGGVLFIDNSASEEDFSLRPIDKEALARLVFNDPVLLKKLNGIIHPLVKEKIKEEIDVFYEEDENALIIVEAALMIEAGYLDILDKLWAVTAGEDLRVRRLIESRDMTVKRIEKIKGFQLSDEEFREKADFVIENSGNMEELEAQIENAMQTIKCAK